MKKSTFAVFGFLLVLSLMAGSCATQLPAFNPSLPNSETAILIIPKHIYIATMNDEIAGWENGKVRIPAGRNTFTLTSEEKVMVVYDHPLGMKARIGSTANYTWVKQWLGPGTITRTFEAGETYIISSQIYNTGTFDSQFAQYTIKPYTDSYPENLSNLGVDFGFGSSWEDKLYMGVSIPLKISKLPIFWTLRLDTNNLGISADYLFYKRFFPHAGLYGYIGAGVGLGASFGEDATRFVALGRAPVGLSWMWIGDKSGFDMYVQGVPVLGTTFPDNYYPYGSWSIDVGMRMWF